PDGLVGDDEIVVVVQDRDLPAQHGFGLPRLALGLSLADARNDVKAVLERRVDAPRDGLVGLAAELPPLGMADDRSVHPELAPHRHRDLAGERAFGLPVAVLRVDADLGVRERLDGLRERDVRRADGDVDPAEVGLAERAAERARLARAL